VRINIYQNTLVANITSQNPVVRINPKLEKAAQRVEQPFKKEII
jgi:hypothetical protein